MPFLHLDNPAGLDARFNLGDEIQVQSAIGFTPKFLGFIPKDELALYCGEPVKIIMNGWFMHKSVNWPPSNSIKPLLVSFHMSPPAAQTMLHSGREFFERHAPVGCRDTQTLKQFKHAGIDAYYSGCLTLSLDRERFITNSLGERRGVYAVDLLYKMQFPTNRKERLLTSLHLPTESMRIRDQLQRKILDELVPAVDRDNICFVQHSRLLGKHKDSAFLRHQAAKEALSLYANAKLVITSRIHCALPCLAFGTPVIFVDGALNCHNERARLDGIIELMPVLNVSTEGSIDFTSLEYELRSDRAKNRADHIEKIRIKLKDICKNFVEESSFSL